MINKNKWSWGALTLLVGVLALAREPSQVVLSSTDPTNIKPLLTAPSNSFLSNFSEMKLVDQHGRAFEPAGLVGHVVLFNFIFTHCGYICPMQTRQLAQVLEVLPADVRERVRFVSISIDPANDTPEKLLDFAKAAGADRDGWLFLTGDIQHIEQLTQRLHIFDRSETGAANKPQIHRTSLWLVDRRGRMLQRYRGDPPHNERIIKELTQLSRIEVGQTQNHVARTVLLSQREFEKSKR